MWYMWYMGVIQVLALSKGNPSIESPSLCAGTNRKSPNDASWEMLSHSLSRPVSAKPDTDLGACMVPANPWHWSGCLHGTRKPLTLIGIPAGYLQTPDTDMGACRVPANRWHQSRYERRLREGRSWGRGRTWDRSLQNNYGLGEYYYSKG